MSKVVSIYADTNTLALLDAEYRCKPRSHDGRAGRGTVARDLLLEGVRERARHRTGAAGIVLAFVHAQGVADQIDISNAFPAWRDGALLLAEILIEVGHLMPARKPGGVTRAYAIATAVGEGA